MAAAAKETQNLFHALAFTFANLLKDPEYESAAPSVDLFSVGATAAFSVV